jgi:hypothetical protein
MFMMKAVVQYAQNPVSLSALHHQHSLFAKVIHFTPTTKKAILNSPNPFKIFCPILHKFWRIGQNFFHSAKKRLKLYGKNRNNPNDLVHGRFDEHSWFDFWKRS